VKLNKTEWTLNAACCKEVANSKTSDKADKDSDSDDDDTGLLIFMLEGI